LGEGCWRAPVFHEIGLLRSNDVVLVGVVIHMVGVEATDSIYSVDIDSNEVRRFGMERDPQSFVI
jgi:hypothetical protein